MAFNEDMKDVLARGRNLGKPALYQKLLKIQTDRTTDGPFCTRCLDVDHLKSVSPIWATPTSKASSAAPPTHVRKSPLDLDQLNAQC